MFNKLVDVLKEVFWLKKSAKKRKTTPKKKVLPKKRAPIKRAVKRVVPKPIIKPLKPKVPPKVKPLVIKEPKLPKVKTPLIDPDLTQVGVITHYFERIKVAIVHVSEGSVIIGDKIHIIGLKTKLMQKVWSMQIDRVDVKVAQKGQDIGLKIDKLVEVGDKVYK